MPGGLIKLEKLGSWPLPYSCLPGEAHLKCVAGRLQKMAVFRIHLFIPFQSGNRLYTSESDVCRRQILTYKDGRRQILTHKDGPRTERT